MSMTTRIVHTGKLLGLIAMITAGSFMQSCNKSKVSAGGSSIYANPDAVQFSKEHYAQTLQRMYLDFYNLPPASKVTAIENAASDDEAKELYNQYVEEFVDSGIMKKGLEDYCFAVLGVGSASGNDTENIF